VAELPRRWTWLIRGFRRYFRRYVRKHVRAVRLAKAGAAFPPADEPVLVVLNHPAWWDPLVGIVLSDAFAGRDQFATIDAAALVRYRIFGRLGFVGVDSTSFRGAADFLRVGQQILSEPNRVLWVTAQGRFADVRVRPLALRSGVGHLAARLGRGVVVPLALEYAFWEERTPEALARYGEPIRVADHPELDGKAWTRLIEERLTHTLDALNADAMSRDPGRFTTVLGGSAGVGGVYDVWRRVKALFTGRRFDASHGAEERP